MVLFAGCLFESVCRLRKEGWGWLCGAQGLTTGTDCGRPNLNQGFVKTQKRRQLVHSRVCEGQKTRFARHTVPQVQLTVSSCVAQWTILETLKNAPVSFQSLTCRCLSVASSQKIQSNLERCNSETFQKQNGNGSRFGQQISPQHSHQRELALNRWQLVS